MHFYIYKCWLDILLLFNWFSLRKNELNFKQEVNVYQDIPNLITS